VRLQITGASSGLPQEEGERVCEPVFTVGDPDQSVDLDLAIAFAIVEQHHGWIECLSEVEGGTHFDLYLPSYGAQLPANIAEISGDHRKGLVPTILLADDEPLVREVGRRILDSQGYRVLLAENGDQALAMFQQEGENIDLVILDLSMPGQFGFDVVEQLVEFDPDVRVLFSSGYFSEDLTGGDGHTRGVINKPYRQDQLVNMVRRALGSGISAQR
jgi:two-component system, cell cycle sensor histidine kinase and response regulator CckA